ncbi:hypothetical protein LINPERPRIM_LOCUS40956, partial [Linum perenne]
MKPVNGSILVFRNHTASLHSRKPEPLTVPYNNEKIFIFSSFSTIMFSLDERYPYDIAEMFCPSMKLSNFPSCLIAVLVFFPFFNSHLMARNKLYLRILFFIFLFRALPRKRVPRSPRLKE